MDAVEDAVVLSVPACCVCVCVCARARAHTHTHTHTHTHLGRFATKVGVGTFELFEFAVHGVVHGAVVGEHVLPEELVAHGGKDCAERCRITYKKNKFG
jgi:hypothetical protein